MVQNRAILTMADQRKVVYGLSNCAIFADLERPLTQFSRSRHYLKYFKNGWRYIHSCYRMWTGNYTQAFKWYHFQWFWVILSDLAKYSMARGISRLSVTAGLLVTNFTSRITLAYYVCISLISLNKQDICIFAVHNQRLVL